MSNPFAIDYGGAKETPENISLKDSYVNCVPPLHTFATQNVQEKIQIRAPLER